MNPKTALAKLNPKVSKPITDIVRATVEAEAGLATQLGLPVAPLGNFAKRTISFGMKVAAQQALEDLRKAGRTTDEYLSSAQAHYNLAQLLDFLDGDIPDEKKFEVMKNILLKAATEENSTREDIRPQQYMQTMRTVPGGAVLIMNACYEIAKNNFVDVQPDGNGNLDRDTWRDKVAKDSGLLSYDLVCSYEEILQQKRLVTGAIGVDQSRIVARPGFRLSQLGIEIMDFAS